MEADKKCEKIMEAIKQIAFQGEYLEHSRYGNGHINDTFLVQFRQDGGSIKKYILQRINHEVFTKPEELMENIEGVIQFLQKKVAEKHGDPNREAMNLIRAKDGKAYYKDSNGCYWRAYVFIEDAVSLDRAEKPEQFYESAVALGNFQCLLADYDAASLHETIQRFHDTPNRYQNFMRAVEEDVCGRAKEVQDEIAFVKEREPFTHLLMDALAEGKIPLRVTHNDTKLNNVMLDNQTGKAVCVIDLDTVMPGLAANDFGDSIRFGASTAAEDETDLSKVSMDLHLYELYAKGYLEGCQGSLTQAEVETLPIGAKMMTLECGMRFLTDYLQGDVYFRIHREKHNLDRCRTQFKLVADMEHKWEQMTEIVKRIAKLS